MNNTKKITKAGVNNDGSLFYMGVEECDDSTRKCFYGISNPVDPDFKDKYFETIIHSDDSQFVNTMVDKDGNTIIVGHYSLEHNTRRFILIIKLDTNFDKIGLSNYFTDIYPEDFAIKSSLSENGDEYIIELHPRHLNDLPIGTFSWNTNLEFVG